MAERSVEGRHSLIHRIRERAPAASMAYISQEVRYKHLQLLAATNPRALSELQQRLRGMETSAGFHTAVLSLACPSECRSVQLENSIPTSQVRVSRFLLFLALLLLRASSFSATKSSPASSVPDSHFITCSPDMNTYRELAISGARWTRTLCQIKCQKES